MTTPCPVRAHRNGAYWLARWTTSDGEPRSRSIGKGSRRQAEKRCWEIAAEFALEPGKRDAGGAPTLSQWHEQYPALRDDLAEGTLALHDRTLRYLIQHLGADTRLDRITPALADDWRLWLGKQPGPRGTISAQTVASHVRNAKVIFGRARLRRLIGANPFDDLSGAAPKVAKDWREVTPADLDKILAACPSQSWRALFALARLAGLRRGEAMRLGWEDVAWDTRRLRVWPEGAEGTKQRAREVPISPRLMEILREGWEIAEAGDAGPCAGVGHADLFRRPTAILKRSGVGTYSKPFHTMRKNLEVEWTRIAPWHVVCAWLGHSPKVAVEHYLRAENPEFDLITGKAGTMSGAPAVVATPEGS